MDVWKWAGQICSLLRREKKLSTLANGILSIRFARLLRDLSQNLDFKRFDLGIIF